MQPYGLAMQQRFGPPHTCPLSDTQIGFADASDTQSTRAVKPKATQPSIFFILFSSPSSFFPYLSHFSLDAGTGVTA